ncbi:MAG: MgtC/SapB family protein [Anaerolineae bacterium]|nr:MgtC/SapB family protein [Anaerolineae bacterium]
MAVEFYRFAVAVGIGLFIGIQRESAYDDPEKKLFAGVRTFALISLAGYTAALISSELNSALPFLSSTLAIGGLIALNYYADLKLGKPGVTTEVTAIIVFGIGAMCYWDMVLLAASIGVSVTVLLSLKGQTRHFAMAITTQDIYASLTFAVISLVVLPVLPNQTYNLIPPLDVLNPHKIWLMVVFTSGISFLGYIMIKIIGVSRGIAVTGLLGGVASSTAVTLSFSQRSKSDPELSKPFSLAIIIAWTVMFVRVLVIVFTLQAALAKSLLLPIGIMAVVAIAYCVYLYLQQRGGSTKDLDFVNPFEWGPALKLGALFAVILVVARGAQLAFGNVGVYLSSFVSGLLDVDAITFTMIDLVSGDSELDVAVGSRAIIIAALSNTLFKGGFAMANGSSQLRKALLPGLLLILAAGAVSILLII